MCVSKHTHTSKTSQKSAKEVSVLWPCSPIHDPQDGASHTRFMQSQTKLTGKPCWGLEILSYTPAHDQQYECKSHTRVHAHTSMQIQEKSEMEASVLGAERSWPYTPVRDPNDKRPLSAISRPLSPRATHTRSP
eukprot:scaffold182645_cov21-Tisochrysis_lutea.AAC.1